MDRNELSWLYLTCFDVDMVPVASSTPLLFLTVWMLSSVSFAVLDVNLEDMLSPPGDM
jgi:hypothetical protein